jgi:hypothetical protein
MTLNLSFGSVIDLMQLRIRVRIRHSLIADPASGSVSRFYRSSFRLSKQTHGTQAMNNLDFCILWADLPIRIPDPQFESGSATQINADPFTAVSEHETILDIAFWGFGLPIWIRIRNLNAEPEPDSATQINTYPCRSVSETLPPPVTILHLKL